MKRRNGKQFLPYLVIAAIAAGSTTASQQPRPESGEIAGTTVRAGSRRPISNATVRLLDSTDESVMASKMTGDDGSFRFENVSPGTYVIEASAQGFAKRRYALHPATKRPLRVTNAGEKIHLETELHLLARITGRVIDERGEGILGAVVWALANVVATERGLEWRQMTVSGGAGTDAEGNFSIGNLLPGEYYLYATPTQGDQAGAGLSALPHGARRSMDGYYPQARTIDEASPVSVLPSETLSDLRVQLTSAPSFCAHGTITGETAASNNFWYAGAISDQTSRVTRNPISSVRLNSGTKELTLCGLPQEPLIIELFGPPPGGVGGRAMITPRKEERTEFELSLGATFPVQVNAHLASETARWCKSTELPSAGCYDTGAIRFSLRSPYTYVLMNPRASRIGPGRLSLDTVFPSAYRATVQLPQGLFVQKAQLGMQSLALEEAFPLDGSVRTIDLTVAESQAKLQIDVSKAKDFGGTIHLVPIGRDAQYARQIVVVTVPQGDLRAEVTGLAPGDYDVVPTNGNDPAAAITVLRNGGGFRRVHIEPDGVASISLTP